MLAWASDRGMALSCSSTSRGRYIAANLSTSETAGTPRLHRGTASVETPVQFGEIDAESIWKAEGRRMRHTLGDLNMFRMAFVIALIVLGSSATAATIQEVSGSQIGCTLKVSGILEDGDAERVASYVGEGWQYKGRICFDSPGGSWMEGLELARAIRRTSTGVDDGDLCESACFLAFMAGTFHRTEDRTPVADRVMHPGARVGYHAPSLPIRGGRYDARIVSEAYNLALTTVAELIQLRNERQISRAVYGELYEFRDELIEDMMRTPPDTMRHVETVGDATFFNIQIHPVELPANLTYRHAAQACKALGRISQDFDMTEDYGAPNLTIAEYISSFSAFFNKGESASRCEITYYLSDSAAPLHNPDWTIGRAFVKDWWIDPNDFEVAAFLHYPFEMSIEALRVPASFSYSDDTRRLRNMATPELNFSSCYSMFGLIGQKSRIIRVKEWVNLRASPGVGSQITGRAEVFEEVSIPGEGFVTTSADCQAACNNRLSDDGAPEKITECIRNHQIWVPIRTASESEGYISRMFLE